MNLFNRKSKKKPIQKKLKAYYTIYSTQAEKPTNQSFDTLIRQGYQMNPYIFACVDKICKGLKSIEWQLMTKDNEGNEIEIKKHPLLDLLKNPNNYLSFDDLLESFGVYLILDGNVYIEKVKDGTNTTKKLISLRPDLMDIEFNTNEDKKFNPIKKYLYRNAIQISYEPEEIIHIKNFNPMDINFGLGKGQPKISASTLSGDLNNQSRLWNNALLKNGAVPTGILEVQSTKDGSVDLDDDVIDEIKEKFKENYSGVDNAGEPVILQYMTWKQMGTSPKDVDWVKGIQQSAREICEGLGVPSILVGDPETKTYNNYKEAKEALYIDTIIPMVNKIIYAFNRSIVSEYDNNLYFKVNMDSVEILREKRMAYWNEISNATFLTENEKRQRLGIGVEDGLDIYRIPANYIDIPKGDIIDIDKLEQEAKSDVENGGNND